MPSWLARLLKAQSATKGKPSDNVSPLSQFEIAISGVDSCARALENTHMRSSVVIRKRAI
jgi:hypothetical protein